jgi:hypothetical protein
VPSVLCPLSPSISPQIEQLLQSADTGQYAQLLREILRKMSREDSSMQLKSLEEVIELGHAIARKENAAKDGKERARKPGAQASPVVARRTSQVPGQTPDPSKTKAKKVRSLPDICRRRYANLTTSCPSLSLSLPPSLFLSPHLSRSLARLLVAALLYY